MREFIPKSARRAANLKIDSTSKSIRSGDFHITKTHKLVSSKGNMAVWRSAVIFCCILHAHSVSRVIESNLLKRLFANYTTTVRPVLDLDRAVQVSLKLNLVSIHDINPKTQVITTSVWLRMRWADQLLQWNESEHGGIRSLIVPQSEVWMPDIVVDNYAKGYKSLRCDDHFLVEIHSDGTVQYEPGDIYETRCDFDITRYPFDSQTCDIVFASWMYRTDKVNISVDQDGVGLDQYLENGEWKLVSTMASCFQIASERLSAVKFTLLVRRKSTFYVLHFLFPLALLTGLSVVVFLVPSEAGEKISLSVTMLVSFTVFLGLIAETIPKTSEHISILAVTIDWYLLLSAFSIVMVAVNLNIRFQSNTNPVPRWLAMVVICFKKPRKKNRSECERSRRNQTHRDANEDSGNPVGGGSSEEKEFAVDSVENASHSNDERSQNAGARQFQHNSHIIVDWQLAAEALDKLLFWLFSTASCFTFLALILLLLF